MFACRAEVDVAAEATWAGLAETVLLLSSLAGVALELVASILPVAVVHQAVVTSKRKNEQSVKQFLPPNS